MLIIWPLSKGWPSPAKQQSLQSSSIKGSCIFAPAISRLRVEKYMPRRVVLPSSFFKRLGRNCIMDTSLYLPEGDEMELTHTILPSCEAATCVVTDDFRVLYEKYFF